MAGIYIHIPFCKQACFYCDFHFSTSLKKKDDLVKALISELELRRHELESHQIETIYFGGGTPSILSDETIECLLDKIYRNYEVIENPEITLEANPDDLTLTRIKSLSKTRINRLSLGIQSFFNDDLKHMNRAHNASEASNSLKYATQYFDNISIDLIYGIPNMNLAKWDENLEIAFSSGVNHISSYALTVEPKTALASFIEQGKYPPIDETLAQEHFNHLVKRSTENGFVHYEISNFGKPDYFSKHNTSYWQGKPYLGIGPSAHSFHGNSRAWNINNNTKYIKSLQAGNLCLESEELSLSDRYNEYIMTGLRTIWGVSLKKVEEEFGKKYKIHLIKEAQSYIENQSLHIKQDVVFATESGKFFIDGIASNLFYI